MERSNAQQANATRWVVQTTYNFLCETLQYHVTELLPSEHSTSNLSMFSAFSFASVVLTKCAHSTYRVVLLERLFAAVQLINHMSHNPAPLSIVTLSKTVSLPSALSQNYCFPFPSSLNLHLVSLYIPSKNAFCLIKKGKAVPLQARGAQRVPGSSGSHITWQRHRMVVRLSALRTGHFLPPGNTPGTHFC